MNNSDLGLQVQHLYNFTISETQNAAGESFPPQGSLYKALAQLCLNHLCTKRGCCSLVCKDSSPRSSARSFQLEPLPIQSFWPQRDKVPEGLINQCVIEQFLSMSWIMPIWNNINDIKSCKNGWVASRHASVSLFGCFLHIAACCCWHRIKARKRLLHEAFRSISLRNMSCYKS